MRWRRVSSVWALQTASIPQASGVASLHAHVLENSAASVYLPLEDKSYLCGRTTATNRQSIVQDPDGYLLRFAESIESPSPSAVADVSRYANLRPEIGLSGVTTQTSDTQG